MIKKGYVPYAEYQKHIRGPWQTVHKLWPHIRNYVPGWGYSKTEIDAFFEGEDGGKKQVDWARITSKPGTFPPSAHTLASHSTKAHSELSDAPANAHHAQLHASAHHVGGADLVNHDSLTGFVAAEHLSLPNTIANVLSDHNKTVHDSLDIDARYIDGIEVVAVAPSNNDVLTYVLANTRWEAQTVPAGTLAGLTDTNIGAPASGDILEYSDVDSKWHNVSDLPPSAHAASHHVAGADLVNHDSLTGFVAAEHLSLPNTIANVLSDHTKAVHDSLDIDARYIDGIEVVAVAPTNAYVLTYVSALTRWEALPVGAGTLAGLTDTSIGAPAAGELLEYSTVDSKWHNVSLVPWTWAQVSKTGSNLTDIVTRLHSSLQSIGVNDHHLEDHTLLSHTTRPHSALTGVTSDLHHPQAHTLTSHSTKAHSELTGIGVNDHHAQIHASAHHVAGGDLVNHDSLTGFLAAEHLSLPNTIVNVLSDHTKAVHDALDIDARYIDGKEVVAPTPTDGHVLMYVLANTRWENKPIGASVALGDLSDVTLGALENADLLQYWTSDSKWHNVADIPPTAHAASHHTGGGDLVNHDSLTGFVAAEHKSLPNTIAQVLSDHTLAVHNALGITTLGSGALAVDHGTAATDEIVNVCYGTGNPPTANTTTIGTLFIKYTA